MKLSPLRRLETNDHRTNALSVCGCVCFSFTSPSNLSETVSLQSSQPSLLHLPRTVFTRYSEHRRNSIISSVIDFPCRSTPPLHASRAYYASHFFFYSRESSASDGRGEEEMKFRVGKYLRGIGACLTARD